jgi:hypothetical protein
MVLAMAAIVMVKVICDKNIGERAIRLCGRSELVEEADSRSIARLWLAEKGWKTIQIKGKLHDRCPDHNPVLEGVADEVNTARTTARMKGWLENNPRNSKIRIKAKQIKKAA